MPVKKSGARTNLQGRAVVRQPGARERSSNPERQAAHAAGAPLGSAGEMARAKAGGRGFLAEARDKAQNVGGRTARGLAAGARGVAHRTSETASQVAGKVRDNKWPALLIGAGATWLAIDAVRGHESNEPAREGRREMSGRTARSTSSDTMRSIKNRGRDIGDRVGQFVRDNPVLAGATTLGLGVAVGMAMPATRAEKAVLGDARQQMLRKAKDAARGTMRSVGDVAESMQRFAGRRDNR